MIIKIIYFFHFQIFFILRKKINNLYVIVIYYNFLSMFMIGYLYIQ